MPPGVIIGGTPRRRKKAAKAMKLGLIQLRTIAEQRARTERHLEMSIADWRLKKRQEWRAVMQALEVFSFGSAYTPTGNNLYDLKRAADRIEDALDQDWVCW